MAEETAPEVVNTNAAVVDTNNTVATAVDTDNAVAAAVDMEVENAVDSKDKRPREENEPKDDIVPKKAKVDEEKSVEEQRLEKFEKTEDGEEKEASDAVKLGPKTFGSSVEMFHYFHKFLNAWPHNLNVNKYEHTMLLELLKNGHAESDKKIGTGVCAFQIREHPRYKNRCYFLIRDDDTADDFSFRKCVDHISPLPEGMQLPKIDVDPADSFIDVHELTTWNLQQAHREVLHRSQREMELHDKNRDGFVSFSEYDPPSWVKSADKDSFGYDMGWWKEEHFNASDADGDGVLNLTEFNDFLHPADSNNTKLQQWLCKEEVRERDSDRDGKVNFKEFFHGLFDLVRNYDEEESHTDSHHSDNPMDVPARKLFAQLDQDGDGYLSETELLPIIGKLHPSEYYYAKQQAEYIISQADGDKDGRLTLHEMIENPYVFYSAIFNDDEDDYTDYHDEFR